MRHTFSFVLTRLIFLIILITVISDSSVAGLPPLIRRRVLFSNPEYSNLTISPDAKRLAYLAPSKGVLNLWVRDIGQTNDSAITNDTSRGMRQYLWAKDNNHLLYLQDKNGDNHLRLYSVNIANRVVSDITPLDGIVSQILGTDRKFPDKVLAAVTLSGKKTHDAFLINITSGEASLMETNPGDIIQWIPDSNFVVRAALAQLPDGGYALRRRDDEKHSWQTIASWSFGDGIPSFHGFSSDNQHLYVEDSRKSNTTRLVELSLKDGSIKVLASDPDYDISQVLINPSDRHVEAVSFYKDREEWKFLDSTVAGVFRFQERYRGDIYISSRPSSGSLSIVKLVKDLLPTSYFLYDRNASSLTFLLSERPSLEKYKLASVSPITVTARDGVLLHAYLTFPQGIEPDSLPLVVLVHDGPWSRDYWGQNPEVQWLANRGYLCLQVNFRGSTGYGKQFLDAGNREWGAKILDDITDAIQWLVETGVADPGRVAIMGKSFGGYTALAGAAFTPKQFACAIDLGGPTNLASLMKSIPSCWEPIKKLVLNRVGNPKKDAKMLKSRSPLFKVNNISIPLLIAQGANNRFVAQPEIEQFVKALKAKGKNVQYMLLPDEGCDLVKPESKLKFYEAAEIFLGKYLGGRIED
jgi:dipeptidyl aminopeptidase/acylaminoacyl peptidase